MTLRLEGYFQNMDNLLKLPVLKVVNPVLKKYLTKEHIKEEYTLRTLIKLVANAHGGVHIEEWKNVPVDLMTDSNSPYNINSNSKLYDLMNNITELVLLALKPLIQAVSNNFKSTRPVGREVSGIFYTLQPGQTIHDV